VQAANLVSSVCHNAEDLLTTWAPGRDRPSTQEQVGAAPARPAPPGPVGRIVELVDQAEQEDQVERVCAEIVGHRVTGAGGSRASPIPLD
jgi:hypothetical protein